MIYVICGVLLLFFVIMIAVGNYDWYEVKNKKNGKKKKLFEFFYKHDETIYVYGMIGAILFALVFSVMTVTVLSENIGREATLASMKEKYKALVYKAESDFIQDEFGFVNKEIVDEIQNWNTDIAYKKQKQNNFWTGIFVADIYDELEVIDLSKLRK